MTKTWLSVLIPTYNGEDYLRRSLQSITKQNASNVEYIAIDDGSSDDTLTILENCKNQIPLKVISRGRTGNWVSNTNIALTEAKSDYVCFLHQDDLWLDGRLSTIKKLITAVPEVNFLLHPARFIDIKDKDLGAWKCPLPAYPKLIDASTMLQHLLIQNFIAIPSPVFRRDLALKLGGLDENLWYTADWDFWLKLAHHGNILYYPHFLTAFRVHPNSQTITRSSYIQDFRHQLEVVMNKHLELWDEKSAAKKKIRKIANFSIEMNTFLAQVIHKQPTQLFYLILLFLSLSPEGWYIYLRDSRITERVLSRLKAQIHT